jgi:hypothetical protein
METGNEANSVDPLDAIHADVVAEASAVPQAADPIPTVPDSQAGPAGGEGLDEDFCEEVLTETVQAHSQGVYDEFYESLAPHTGHEKADRIARRAAMSPPTQRVVSKHGARVLRKYGLDRYVNGEGALIAALLLYFRGLTQARRERDAILKGRLVQQTGAQ